MALHTSHCHRNRRCPCHCSARRGLGDPLPAILGQWRRPCGATQDRFFGVWSTLGKDATAARLPSSHSNHSASVPCRGRRGAERCAALPGFSELHGVFSAFTFIGGRCRGSRNVEHSFRCTPRNSQFSCPLFRGQRQVPTGYWSGAGRCDIDHAHSERRDGRPSCRASWVLHRVVAGHGFGHFFDLCC